jgi:hypothetical protein
MINPPLRLITLINTFRQSHSLTQERVGSGSAFFLQIFGIAEALPLHVEALPLHVEALLLQLKALLLPFRQKNA